MKLFAVLGFGIILFASCSNHKKGQAELQEKLTKIEGQCIVLNQKTYSEIFPEVIDDKIKLQFSQVLSHLTKNYESDSLSVLTVTSDTILYKNGLFSKGEIFVFSKNKTACVVLNKEGMIVPVFNPISHQEIQKAFSTSK